MSEKVVQTKTARQWRFVGVEGDLSDVFVPGERVVVIAESEYERLKALERAAHRLTTCDDGIDD